MNLGGTLDTMTIGNLRLKCEEQLHAGTYQIKANVLAPFTILAQASLYPVRGL